ADASLFARRTVMTLLQFVAVTLGVLVALLTTLVVVFVGTRVIREDQSGLVVKRFGPPLPSGRIIALDGEAGYQARLLSPGWHFGLWRWKYKVEKVPVIVVQPREIALVVAADGKPVSSGPGLARAVP